MKKMNLFGKHQHKPGTMYQFPRPPDTGQRGAVKKVQRQGVRQDARAEHL